MLTFWVNLTRARIDGGMDKEEALSKVPVKYRDAVRQIIEGDK